MCNKPIVSSKTLWYGVVKEDKEQLKTTELLLPGDNTYVEFELNVRRHIIAKNLPLFAN